jgi:hypothetical protein
MCIWTGLQVADICMTSGFIAKALFLERLTRPPQSSDLFFLYSILSVSARFTPSLVKRYGGGLEATKVFIDRAMICGLQCLHQPTVENTQAFFLLGLGEWGSGDKSRSSVSRPLACCIGSTSWLTR